MRTHDIPIDIGNLGDLSDMTKHEALNMILRVQSNKMHAGSGTDRVTGEHVLPPTETVPQHTRSNSRVVNR